MVFMTANRRKKNVKMRGKSTHGHGSKKKRRGSGSRGGAGLAGRFKHKKTFFKRWGYDKDPRFKSLQKRGIIETEKSINIGDLVRLTDKSEIDASEFGYGKVLSEGKLDRAVTVKARKFSERAKQKIEAAGGKAVIEE